MSPHFIYISSPGGGFVPPGLPFIPPDISGDLYNWGRNNVSQLARSPLGENIRPKIVLASQVLRDINPELNGAHIVKADGTMFAGGFFSGLYTIGDGSTSGQVSPYTQVGVDSDWALMGGKYLTVFATKENGALYGYGENANWQLGLGDTTDRTSFTFIDAGPWLSFDASEAGGVGVKTNGTLWAWGRHSLAPIGDGGGVDRTTPVRIGTAADWSKCVMARDLRFALNDFGELYVWGKQSANGEAGLGLGLAPATINTPTQIPGSWQDIDASWYSVTAVASNGDLYEWGLTNRPGAPATQIDSPNKIGTDSDWNQCYVASNTGGTLHFGALKDDETLHTWGLNDKGQLGRIAGGTLEVGPVDEGIYGYTFKTPYAPSIAHATGLSDFEFPTGPWHIQGMTLDLPSPSFDFNAIGTDVQGFFIADNGNKLISAPSGGLIIDLVIWNVGTAYDMSTITGVFSSGNCAPGPNFEWSHRLGGVWSNDSGTKMFLLLRRQSNGHLYIEQIDFTTPFDMTTASFTFFKDITALVPALTSGTFYVKPDQTGIWIYNAGVIYEFDFTFAGDLSTLNFVKSRSLSGLLGGVGADAIAFGDNGNRFYTAPIFTSLTGPTITAGIVESFVETPYDIDTIFDQNNIYELNPPVPSGDATFQWRPDGSRLYVVSENNSELWQFDP
jgi:hypothetical protein